jgi:phosphoribosylformylglycinamidine synthase subunit PurQ / glutaminase
MKAVVLLFPGINRETDMVKAIADITGQTPAVVWHTETALPAGTDLVVVPGGFSYGDYLRCGAIAARSPVMDAVRAFAAAGGYVLGVCNGFQIITEAGLLPGALMRNGGLKFICKIATLRVETAASPFTSAYQQGQVVRYPVAHGEGNYRADAETLRQLEAEDRIALRYCDATGAVTEAANINGSLGSIAGILSANRRVLGLMPHPENFVLPHHGGRDGRGLFESLAHALVAA